MKRRIRLRPGRAEGLDTLGRLGTEKITGQLFRLLSFSTRLISAELVDECIVLEKYYMNRKRICC